MKRPKVIVGWMRLPSREEEIKENWNWNVGDREREREINLVPKL